MRGASSPGPMCPHTFVLLCLTLPDTQPSPDTPTSHPPLPMLLHRWPPGHILRLQARPLFPEQRGVCAGSMCPRTTQGTQTCSQVQACSQGSLKLPSPGDSQPLPGHPAYHGNTVPPSGRRSMVSWICSLGSKVSKIPHPKYKHIHTHICSTAFLAWLIRVDLQIHS